MYLLFNSFSSSEICLFISFAHLLIRLFVLLLFDFVVVVYSGYQSFISCIAGENFLPSVCYPSILVIISFDDQNLFFKSYSHVN
jgi:hypothetical protein